MRKIIEGKKELKESSFYYDYLRKNYPSAERMVSSVGKAVEWDTTAARSFCLHLLEDVNDHRLMAELEKFFDNYEDSENIFIER